MCVVSETSIKYTFVLGDSVPIFLNILNGEDILIIKRTVLESQDVNALKTNFCSSLYSKQNYNDGTFAVLCVFTHINEAIDTLTEIKIK